MPLLGEPSLTHDEIDDLLYFTRTNESADLNQTTTELAQKYQCSGADILSCGVDAETGNTVLHYCSANGFADLLKALLAHLALRAESDGFAGNEGAGVAMINSTNKEGNTPLHWAAYNGHLEAVKMLVGAGADMWIKNSAGHLAMFEAERAEQSEVVQFLLEAGGEKVDRAGVETESAAEVVPNEQSGQAEATASADVSMEEAGPSG